MGVRGDTTKNTNGGIKGGCRKGGRGGGLRSISSFKVSGKKGLGNTEGVGVWGTKRRGKYQIRG